MFFGKNNGPVCPMCHIVQIKLIPLYDNDNSHKKQMCCLKCKKAIKNQEPIEKFDRIEVKK